MNDKSKMDPATDMRIGDMVESDLDKTVLMSVPDTGMTTGMTESSDGDGAIRSPEKREVEDFVRGVNINPYISLSFDISSELESPLDAVESKYAMLSVFAEGGTAKVSIARDRNLRRLVAVKSLKKGAKNYAALLDAFVTEAKVTAQLDHPGIIPIYGLAKDEDNGIHLVMKLVDGKTLREYLRNLSLNYRINGIDAFDEDVMLQKRLEIFLRVCDTIAYAHHRNVIHRDLKPENIMIGKFMEVFVMDWGLAKVLSPEDGARRVGGGKVSGTPRYFPPEVLRGEPPDFRSDIFTLGLILQEIVTLQYAIAGSSEKEIIEHTLSDRPAPIEHLFHRKIDRNLQAIIRKATAYSLKDRYQSVEELSDAIRRYMVGLSIPAERRSLRERLLRVFKRRR